MTLGGVLAALRSRWLVLCVAIAMGTVTGAVVALATPKSFEATSTLVLRWVGPGAEAAEADTVRYVTARTRTFALLVQRTDVLVEAARSAGVTSDIRDLRRRVSAEVPLGSQLIRIHARAGEPLEAAALANAVSGAMVSAIPREDIDSPSESGLIDAVVVVNAALPTTVSSPRLSMYVAVGTVAGLVCGSAAALLLTYLSARRAPRRLVGSGATAPPVARGLSMAHVVWGLLIAATVSWRSDTYYEGGADPVVLAKAAISLCALVLAMWLFFTSPARQPVPAAPMLTLLVYVGVTLIGGFASDDIVAAGVVGARVLILLMAVGFLSAAYGAVFALRSLVHVLALAAAMGALTGLPAFAGRLRGGIPPLHPNELAFVGAVVAVWFLSKILSAHDSLWDLCGLFACVAIVVLTGSRTGLGAMALACLFMAFRITAMRVRTFVVLVCAIPGVALMMLGTDLLGELYMRGGGEEVATLSNRTIAWNAALNLDRDVWQTWFGEGLAQKKIPVPGQFWDTQLLDSSWISALVQGGTVGLVLVSALAAVTLFHAAFSQRSSGSLCLGLVMLCVLAGFLESGLFDASLLFLVFLVAGVAAFSSHGAAIRIDRRAVTASASTERTEHPVV